MWKYYVWYLVSNERALANAQNTSFPVVLALIIVELEGLEDSHIVKRVDHVTSL